MARKSNARFTPVKVISKKASAGALVLGAGLSWSSCIINNPAFFEDCSNGVDDDFDGATDCLDSKCSFGGFCNPPSICGNGIPNDGIFGGEGCDDGNLVNGDGCSASCQIEAGFECSPSFNFAVSTCAPLACGNGLSQISEFEINPAEQCDDGNSTDSDGCDSNCTLTACGNGVISEGESCDDANVIASDGCSDACQVEQGFACDDLPSLCVALVEDCTNNTDDDQDTLVDCADQDCAASCQIFELCQNGTDDDSDGAVDCQDIDCASDPLCLSTCGDGVVDTNEACDTGAQNSDTTPDACRTDCTLPQCGDGVVDTNEVCDDGNTDDTDGCNNACGL